MIRDLWPEKGDLRRALPFWAAYIVARLLAGCLVKLPLSPLHRPFGLSRLP